MIAGRLNFLAPSAVTAILNHAADAGSLITGLANELRRRSGKR
jgi:hypothetical protein